MTTDAVLDVRSGLLTPLSGSMSGGADVTTFVWLFKIGGCGLRLVLVSGTETTNELTVCGIPCWIIDCGGREGEGAVSKPILSVNVDVVDASDMVLIVDIEVKATIG